MITDLGEISRLFDSRERQVIPETGRPRAAVLVALYGPGPDYRVLYTVRTQRVEHHKGETSFPGGGCDPEDSSLTATALRESFEEVGIEPQDVTVLGLMNDMVTRSNFVVTPVLGRVGPHPYRFRCHEAEVAELLEVPLSHLADPANQVSDPRGSGSASPRPFPSFQFGPHLIFGATAFMTTALLSLLQSEGAVGSEKRGGRG